MMIRFRTIDVNGLWEKEDSRSFDFKEKIPRDAMVPIFNRLNKNTIEVIIGPRQSGKTTLLYFTIHHLIAKGVQWEDIYYLNLDTTLSYSLFEDPLMFMEHLRRRRKKEVKVYLFLDEIQRLKTPGKFLKGIYDLEQNIKIFVSGSSSLEIRSKIKEYLTGRKRETHLLPISFTEMISHEKKLPNDLFQVKLTENTLLKWQKTEKVYGDYLSEKISQMSIYGGYPAVCLSENHEEKIEILSEIFHSYVRRDVVSLMNIEKVELFTKLVQTLSSQTSSLINKSEISSLIGSNSATISKYIQILNETYITMLLPPYVTMKRNEIKNAHKCYFIDNGLRNFAIRLFGHLSERPDKGALIENLVFSSLVQRRALSEQLYFWRTKAGAEMDFVFIRESHRIPVEIKSGPAVKGSYTKSFHSFLNKFSTPKAIYLNKSIFDIQILKDTTVYVIPIHWFLLLGPDMVMSDL